MKRRYFPKAFKPISDKPITTKRGKSKNPCEASETWRMVEFTKTHRFAICPICHYVIEFDEIKASGAILVPRH